jgi:class 3 adenylate cyclase/tetratricopeptide (TPR) repeat protein
MKCPGCRHDNDDESKFCEDCGKRLERLCDTCGAPLKPASKFCPACGEKAAGAAPPVSTSPPPAGYTPPHLAEKILASRSALEGERKQVTVLFVDVAGSMDHAGRVDAETWHEVLDGFFRILADGIHRFEGTINQYTGDGVMALFGAPIAHEDHAQRACFTVLHLREALRDYADELKRKHGFGFQTRMGLNSGEVVVGKIGDDLRMDYTAQGHAVGLAQRMEQLAFPGEAYLTQATADLVRGYFELRDLGEFDVKGGEGPLSVFELQGLGAMKTRLDMSRERGLSTFVGRKAETETLETVLEEAIAGNGQVVGVVAEAGVGKSRLCDEFVAMCRAKGLAVYEGHCPPHGKSIPHLPVLQLLREYFGIDEREDRHSAREKVIGRLLAADKNFADVLGTVLEFLGIADPGEPTGPANAGLRRRRLFEAVQQLIRIRSEREPAVMFIDDLHWIDAASDEMVSDIVDVVGATRTLLLINFRPEYSADWMRKSFYRQIPLQPLGPEDIGRLASEFLGNDLSVEGLAERIGTKTGGNPFFTEEVLLSLVESGALKGEKGAFVLQAPISEIEIPGRVQALIAARIDRLSETEKNVLQAAAVVGRAFPESVVCEVSALSNDECSMSLKRLVAAELIYEKSSYPSAEFVFKHPITHEVAYETQLASTRSRMHARVARALEEASEDRSAEFAPTVARHWELAGENLRAATWYAEAGKQSNVTDPTGASAQLNKVLELVPAESAVNDAEAATLRMNACRDVLTVAAWRVGVTTERAEALYEEGKALGAVWGDASYLTELAIAFAPTHGMGRGQIDDYYEWGKEVVRLARETGDRELMVSALTVGSYSKQCFGRLSEALEEASEILDVTGDDLDLGHKSLGMSASVFARAVIPMLVGLMGDMASARKNAARGVEIARSIGIAGDLVVALITLVEVEGWSGHPEQSEAAAREAHRATETHGLVFGRIIASLSMAEILRTSGRFEEAAEIARSALELIRSSRTGLEAEPAALRQLGEALAGLGQIEEARGLLDEAFTLAVRRKAVLEELWTSRACARFEIQAGGPDSKESAERYLGRTKELIEQTGAVAFRPLVSIERARSAEACGDTQAAVRYYRDAEESFERQGVPARAAEIREIVAGLQAL